MISGMVLQSLPLDRLVSWSAFYHLCLVRPLVPDLIPQDVAKVTHAVVTSRLVYCNSARMGPGQKCCGSG